MMALVSKNGLLGFKSETTLCRRLEMEADGGRDCARRNIMRSAKRREEVVESLLIREIDHR